MKKARSGATGLAFLVLSLPAAAEPFHHPFGEWREYNRDWLAACPDAIDEDAEHYYGFSCFASTGSQEMNGAGQPAYKLTVIHNRLTGDVEVAVTVAADDVVLDTGRPLAVAFGGEAPERFDFVSDLETRHNTANQFFVADEAREDALLDRMIERNAMTVTFPVQGPATEKDVRFSLRGVTASIDFMATYARRVTQY